MPSFAACSQIIWFIDGVPRYASACRAAASPMACCASSTRSEQSLGALADRGHRPFCRFYLILLMVGRA